MKARSEKMFRFAPPLRAALQRAAFALSLIFCMALLALSRTDNRLIEHARTAVADLLSPALDAVSRPALAIDDAATSIRSHFGQHEEIERLRLENLRLREWQDAARRLDEENQALRALLNFTPDAQAKYVAGRVIADSGGSFARSILVSVGAGSGVRKGQAAMTGDGLVGRVLEVGERTARILLLTDLNSRIPVQLEGSRDRAMLAGDNTATPRLIYQSATVQALPGDRVVTSGDGGALPAGLPIGQVAAVSPAGVIVQPFAEIGRLNVVRLIDYGLPSFEPPQAPAARGARR